MNLKPTLFCLILSILSLPVAGKDFAIRLHRPAQVGEEYTISKEVKRTRVSGSYSAGKTLKETNEDFTLIYEALEKVLKVNAIGKPVSVIHSVIRWDRVDGKGTTSLLSKGAEITATLEEGKPTFKVDGNVPDAALAKELVEFVSLSTSELTEDEMNGTKDRKKVGDKWPVNPAAKESFEKGSGIPVKSLTGEVTFVGEVDGIMNLLVNVDIVSQLSLPSGIITDSALMKISVDAKFPAEHDEGNFDRTATTTFDVLGHKDMPSGEKVDVKTSLKEVKRIVTKRVKKAP